MKTTMSIDSSKHSQAHGPKDVTHPLHVKNKKHGTILTVRATSGLSGDMMLAGMASMANINNHELAGLVKELGLPALEGVVQLEKRLVNNIAGVGCRITLPHEHVHRNLVDIRAIITASAMPHAAQVLALQTFTILGTAEAAVHGQKPEEVHFHEVGALDSILDICLVCRLYTIINPQYFVCSPLPLADGVIHCAHGYLASPAPAVLHLLKGIPVSSFLGQGETITPTALSLLRALNARFGPWPTMTIANTVISYGSKIFENVPNGAIWAIGKEEI